MFDIVNKSAFKTDAHGPMHTDQQHDAGGENRQKQLAGDSGPPDFHYRLLLRREMTMFCCVSFGTRAKIIAGSAIITAIHNQVYIKT
ncbi:Uncharacterised protein [Salmonella enterica subsp. enterica serovar Bovismorbificans]|uniref:Uncharacterized protein n=1 Tax=Salmonella enterica subsp. enterica serovar Bovismorbificans TaxID=58097 RepID=A0A655C578_SALET|nr:Uncharacterised protein [Salmonella enterica subsp. enterica serovar Bovismorbificans]CNT96896.1 Uncharacterised protein [Salmonella enterica subsp. enterica serovar Bovismorbificans]